MPAELTRNFLGETAISGQVRKKFEVIGIFHSGFSVFPEKISDFSDEEVVGRQSRKKQKRRPKAVSFISNIHQKIYCRINFLVMEFCLLSIIFKI